MKSTKIVGLTIREITLIGMMIAIIEVCKVALAGIPNVELTSCSFFMLNSQFFYIVFWEKNSLCNSCIYLH